MNISVVKNFVDKIPVIPIILLYFCYLGFDYYSFETDPASAKQLKLHNLVALKEQNSKYEKKYQELTLFVKSLEKKKFELRGLAEQLQDAKAVLSEDVDLPGFMKMITTEARKLNLVILALKPNGSEDHSFYGEVHFNMGFRGVFLQLVSFLQRLGNLTRIIRVDDFKIVVGSGGSDRFTLLDGQIGLTVFKYVGSQEDKLGKKEAPAVAGPK